MEQVMTINKIKKIIQNDYKRRQEIIITKRYYNNDNDIKLKGILPDSTDPLRNADNRISDNFHEDFTDEKSAYIFTNPVLFDLGDKELNKKIKEVLGDDFKYESNNLCINATNCKVAWLHYWIDNDEKMPFQYATVETEEIIPQFKNGLKRKLEAIHRYYQDWEEDVYGKIKYYVWYEYWDEIHCEKYKFRGKLDGTGLTHLPEFDESFEHNFGTVPFIEFRNNKKQTDDLKKYKDLLDIYDKVLSGFANDLEDIQQLIYILENYGGENLKEFLGDLKRYKTVKTETGADGRTNGGLKTLQIEIPVEARKTILEILEKRIYKAAQSLDMDNSNFGNSSGVALKFFYRKLELKAGLLQIEFERGFNQLIRAILQYLGITEYKTINQTWTRNMISNDLENAQIAVESKDVISDKTIIKNHPWVEDPEDEYEKVKKQKEEAQKRQQDIFKNAGGFQDEEDNDSTDKNEADTNKE